jgi:tocopherol O-methyltransferase
VPGRGSFASVEPSPAAVAAHYDGLDAFYREVWGAHVHHGLWIRGDETYEHAKENLVCTVAGKARIGAGSSVCDIGCGYGETARWIAQHLKSHVTGITVSRAQYDYARAHALNNTHQDYILGDWLTNNLPDHSFDAAVAIESSEHMPDLRAFFAQARRVLSAADRS